MSRTNTDVTPSERASARESRGKALRELWTGKVYFVYIVANATRLLYIGITRNLLKRMWQHKTKASDDGYTTHWTVCRLVYFECFEDVNAAIAREKQLKRWRREKKIWLIERENRDWHDLSEGWYFDKLKGPMPCPSTRA